MDCFDLRVLDGVGIGRDSKMGSDAGFIVRGWEVGTCGLIDKENIYEFKNSMRAL